MSSLEQIMKLGALFSLPNFPILLFREFSLSLQHNPAVQIFFRFIQAKAKSLLSAPTKWFQISMPWVKRNAFFMIMGRCMIMERFIITPSLILQKDPINGIPNIDPTRGICGK
jgi:hypothetical protein